MKKWNILFVHPLEGNAYELYKAFKRNNQVNIIPLLATEKPKNNSNTLISKIRHKVKIPTDTLNINSQLLTYDLNKIDIIFIIKGNEIYPNTLKRIRLQYPKTKLVNWTQDDMFAWHNRSIFYTISLKYYDLIVTTKSYNIDELPRLGARKILFHDKVYSKDIHIPQKCTGKYNCNIIFIGYPEYERIQSLLFLANNGIVIDIYGYPEAWKKSKDNISHKNIRIHSEFLYGKNYAEALSCAKISLCFLRKLNRDLQTSRSVEIPACGGFMIAERTTEHLKLFKEDTEAVYFDSDEELLEKVRYYLDHKIERKRIAQNGYNRCINNDYSYDDVVIKILRTIQEIKN